METRLKVSLSPFYHLSGQGATKEATQKKLPERSDPRMNPINFLFKETAKYFQLSDIPEAQPATTAANNCTPANCPECELPKVCDPETNLSTILEAANHYSATIQSLDEIFGQFGHCGIREHIDHESFPPKRYIGIQVMKRELLNLVPGELKYIPWVNEEVAYQVQRVISPNVRVTYLVKHGEVQHGEVHEMDLGDVEKEVIINE